MFKRLFRHHKQKLKEAEYGMKAAKSQREKNQFNAMRIAEKRNISELRRHVQGKK